MLTSTQNPKLKLVRALLGRPKERREAGAFVAEGVRLVEDAFAAGWPFRFVLYTDGLSERGRALLVRLRLHGVDVEQVSASLLAGLSETETSQGLLAVLGLGNLPIPDHPTFILVLDQLRDPGNLGTLLRTAAAVGVQAVLLPPETADAFAPKVVRAGMGAHFHLPVHELDWPEIESFCTSAGLQVYLADMGGRSCWQTDLTRPLALIVGGEAQGASQPARRLAFSSVSLPMPGAAESLNVAVAGSALMFEVLRQRSTLS